MEAAGSRDLVTERRFQLPPAETAAGSDPGTPPALVGGRYELGELLGSGGTARVYRARDRTADGAFAVKLFHRTAATTCPRHARETAILQGLDHPGVVGLHDAGLDDGRAYLVMQLVEGEDLAERLLSGPLPLAEILAMASRLAEALAHVHERGVIHRDLKPANVLLGREGAMITDFGVAHLLDTTRVTAAGSVAGTAAYLAPEQVLGEPVGPPADVYALGLVLIEAVTAEREYPGARVESALARLSRPPRIPEGLPEPLSQVLHLMTARDPAVRPTAAEVARVLSGGVTAALVVVSPTESGLVESALMAASPSETGVVIPSGLTAPPPSLSSRRRGVVTAAVLSPVAAAVVLVALVTGGGRVTQTLRPPSPGNPAPPTTSAPSSSSAPPVLATTPPPAAKAQSGGSPAGGPRVPPPSMTTVTATATAPRKPGNHHHTPFLPRPTEGPPGKNK